MQPDIFFTRRVSCTDAEITDLIKVLYSSEAIPSSITRYDAREDRLIVYGKVHNIHHVSLEITKALLTIAARQEGIIQKWEHIEGFALDQERNIVFLVRFETDDEQPVTLSKPASSTPTPTASRNKVPTFSLMLTLSAALFILMLFWLL